MTTNTPVSLEEALSGPLKRWGVRGAHALTLISESENLVFRLNGDAGETYILRLHRPGYHSCDEIASELRWITALETESPVNVPAVVAAEDAEIVQLVCLPEAGEERFAVLMRESPGEQPDTNDPRLPELFTHLGEAAALCHLHVQNWQRPESFTRPVWDMTAMIGPFGLWGDWRRAAMTAEQSELLEEVATRVAAQHDAYGRDQHRFGLIHNDMRPSNFLWHDGRIRLIDFDDCGFGWYMADFAASVSWIEDDPRVPELFARWSEGYRKHRELTAADVAIAPAAILARRLLLLAWTVSRADTPLARAHAEQFLDGTCALAKRYLAGDSLV